MPQVQLHVRLLEMSQHPVALIYAACRQCYSARFAGDLFDENEQNPQKQAEFIRKVVASGHESPLEHVTFTFAIEGVSRALTHQLVRHRIASFSQQSQRYVKETDFGYVVPPSIEQDEVSRAEFVRTMEMIQSSYHALLEAFKEKGKVGEQANQDVRFVLPQAAETKIVVTMNTRELIHFFHQRCCRRAQWEIKRLAEEMLKICRDKLPEVFADVAAKCDALGYCPEGENLSCGRRPLKEQALEKRVKGQT
ncbi:MAG: FAD-dependent thymidylate synthase [Candidatus Omnitrophica bacterium]|nr:FAD-dependent thymidylate synthase [Candidatus Omnitrophota bacterium]MDD5573758.1 FAD-dependent thymidylate synthase [Candidatus Omnitrophota bacterium]